MDNILFNVSGMKYIPKKVLKVLAEELASGDELTLKREPNNEFDENAVKVFFDGTFIGYVERDWSKEVSNLLKSGKDYECKVFDCNPEWDTEITDSGREREFVADIDLLVEIEISE